jgi:hypothetical protein
MTEYQINVGDEVVPMDFVGGYAAPISHNTIARGPHNCRGRVLKVGRKLVHVETIGAAWQLYPLTEADMASVKTGVFRRAVPLAIAKKLYRESFERNPSYRTQDFINQCVEGL